ncbi:MAG TPA: polysaccharide deacetylase family protein [Limnobacter sp.]|uniref:polysaccharide deacetylase family protein n=1 Tax=Limnobacter sp. TaxID=2003368 RepID=UPI002ED7E74F
MSRFLALKVDVDTWRGTREGVPQLMKLFDTHGVRATFLFSLGPDHTGRAIKRVFRPGFLGKVSRTSVLEHYGLKTLLYGTLLPGPDIGRREAALMRGVKAAGHEVGVHCWDHIRWQDGVAQADTAWTEREFNKAMERFADIFGCRPAVHGAAGWQMNDAAYELERRWGLLYASDGRGTHPFQPVNAQGMPMGVPQLPTTLPTLDELIGLDGWTPDNVHEALLGVTRASGDALHVYTLHAELEGLRLLDVLDRLLHGWKAQGYTLGTCLEVFRQLNLATLPHHTVDMGEIAGRSGALALQGRAVGTALSS